MLYFNLFQFFFWIGKEQSADGINQVVDRFLNIMDLNNDENITKEIFAKKALMIVELKQVIENPNL